MQLNGPQGMQILIVVTPSFNLTATTGFIDPFRAANYLEGKQLFRWSLASVAGGEVAASNGLTLCTAPLADFASDRPDLVVVSSSWTPEAHRPPTLLAALRKWARAGVAFAGLDTGAFILAAAGLLKNRRATCHYEHIDALKELHEDIDVSEELFVMSPQRFTCCGGIASVDLALRVLEGEAGNALANAAARYIFHSAVRREGAPQNPSELEPMGLSAPIAVRQVIALMERNLEETLSIPGICAAIGLSQRQVSRLFDNHVGKSPVLYYRDIRLDRARGLVTQTDLPISEVAAATGFSNQMHFSKAYKERFGIPPRTDRSEGRIPFEFRAWPMHRKTDRV